MDKVRSEDGTSIAFEWVGQGPPLIFVVGAFNDRAKAAPLAVLAHIPAVTLHRPTLAHGPVSALAPLDGARLPERWWFA